MNSSRSNRVLLFAAIAAHVPIGFEYSLRMWKADHYQFFPLVLLVVAYLFYVKHDYIAAAKERGEAVLSMGLFLFTLATVTIATLLNSSFVGAVSMLLLAGTTVYWAHGRSGFTRALPLLSILIFVIPLPGRLDERLIFGLQVLSSRLASWMLDGIGQVHFREGVILITEQKQFLTEEACSGVRSLFSSLAAIAIYGLINRYSPTRHLFNVLQTIFWVVVGNALRVAIAVFVTDNYSDVVAEGAGHQLLGIVIFWFILLMAISVDHLVKSIFPASPDPELAYADTAAAKGDHRSPSWLSQPLQSFAWAAALSVAFALIFLIGARMIMVRQSRGLGNTVVAAERLPFPKLTDLPETIGEWTRIDFQHESRGEHNLQAEDSFIWTYQRGDLEARLSIDCPWDNWHDLSICYTGLGWNARNTFNYGLNSGLENDVEDVGDEDKRDNAPNGSETTGYTRSDLVKATGESGVVFFSSIDRNGNEITPMFSSSYLSFGSAANQMADNISMALGMSSDTSQSGIALPASTLQVLCIPPRGFRDGEVEQLKVFFLESRQLLLKTPRYGNDRSSGNESPVTAEK